MVRRLAALLVALAIAFVVPPGAAGHGAPAGLVMAVAGDCICPNAGQDCADHGTAACDGALACAVQCGVGLPMMAGEPGPLAPASPVASTPVGRVRPLVSALATLPFRPPTPSIHA